MNPTMRTITAVMLLLVLQGCSVAALVQEQSLENRMTALESRMHTLEAKEDK